MDIGQDLGLSFLGADIETELEMVLSCCTFLFRGRMYECNGKSHFERRGLLYSEAIGYC